MNSIGPIIWRARAFQGQFLEAKALEPDVSELYGEDFFESGLHLAAHRSQQFLMVVRTLIEADTKHRQQLNSKATVKPFMTVNVERVADKADSDSCASELMARVDFITDGRVVWGSLRMKDMPCIDLKEVQLEDGDSVWEVFVRLLVDIAKEGFAEPADDRHSRS